MRRTLRRLRTSGSLGPLVLLLAATLLFPLHVHRDETPARVGAHCAWQAGGEGLVFGEAHADGHDHLCPLGHAASLAGPAALPPRPGPALGLVPLGDTSPGHRLPRRVSCRGPPPPSVIHHDRRAA